MRPLARGVLACWRRAGGDARRGVQTLAACFPATARSPAPACALGAHPRAGMERLLQLQRELLGVVAQCTAPSPMARPTFGAIGRRLRAIQKQAARAGLADVSPRGPGSEAALASLTPRTCVTEAAFSPRSPLSKTAAC